MPPTSPANPKEFKVSLVAPTGKAQDVLMQIKRTGVHLFLKIGEDRTQELNTFPFEVIKKWLPSNLRSRNVGPENCLDLQIETDRGPRDLRMRTDSPQTVRNIIHVLRETVQAVLRDLEPQPPPPPTTDQGAETDAPPPPPPPPAKEEKETFTVQDREVSTSEVFSNQAFTQTTPKPPPPPPGPSRQEVSSLQAHLVEMTEQNKFQESLIKRLSAEVSLLLPPNSRPPSYPLMEVDDGYPLPPWLKDRRYLNPLLTSYDNRLGDLETKANEASSALEQLQKQMDEVVAENDKLQERLAQMHEQAASLGQDPRSENATQALLRKENTLMREENDILTNQQGDMERELQRLHEQLEEQKQAAVRQAQEEGTALMRSQQEAVQAQVMAAQHAKLQAALRAADQRAAHLEHQLVEARSQLEDEHITTEAAKRSHDMLSSDQGSLRERAQAADMRARVATEKLAALQVECTGMRDRLEAAEAAAASGQRDCKALRHALSSVESKLAEYQHKDAEVYTRIREALEAAEGARLARDGSLAKQKELEAELAAMQQRMAGVRQAVRDQVYAELQDKLHALTKERDSSREAAAASESQANEARAASDQAARENLSRQAELRALKEEMAETLSSKSRMNLMTVETMEQIQAVERQRDEAVGQMEREMRRMDRTKKEWALERQHLELELRTLRRIEPELEAACTTARGEAAGYARQCETLGRELVAARQAKERSDAELRQQIANVRAERDAEIRGMAARLEATVASAGRSVGEAEQHMASQEALMARWREEAQMVATKLDAALASHRRELTARETEMATLTVELQGARAAHAGAAAEAEGLRAVAGRLQQALLEAEATSKQLHLQVLGGSARQEDLEQELRTLQATLEHLGHSQQQQKLLQQNQPGAAGIDATSFGLAQKLDQLRRAHAI